MAKPGPKSGTVNNPKGINQYTSKGPSNPRINNQRQLAANKEVRKSAIGYAQMAVEFNRPINKGVKQFLGMSTTGPTKRWTPGKSKINYPSKTLSNHLSTPRKMTMREQSKLYKNAHPERKKQLENWSMEDVNSAKAYVKGIKEAVKKPWIK